MMFVFLRVALSARTANQRYRRPDGLTCLKELGERQEVSGPDFSRAENSLRKTWASAPEKRIAIRIHIKRAAFFIVGLCLSAVHALPQSSQSTTSPDQSAGHHGQIIFSRSADQNGQTTTTTGPAAAKSGAQIVSAPVATDDERQALAFTAFDMDVHLRLDEHEIAVRALLHIRNDGKSPLAHIPLQISSSLTWEREFASMATIRLSLSPRSTQMSTTPASFTKPPSHLASRSHPVQRSISMSRIPVPSN